MSAALIAPIVEKGASPGSVIAIVIAAAIVILVIVIAFSALKGKKIGKKQRWFGKTKPNKPNSKPSKTPAPTVVV